MCFAHLIPIFQKLSNIKNQFLYKKVCRILKLKFLLSFLYCFVACQVDPSPKKQPRIKKQIINKSVTDTHKPFVDILFIIDDSVSMDEKQNILAKNAELFINQFFNTEFIDYHIGVTTSSVSETESVAPDGKLNRCNNLAEKEKYNYSNYVHRKTPDADLCLKEMMKVGTRGSTLEHFLNIPSLTFSKTSTHSLNFYRPDAHLAVFVITDEGDHSSMTAQEAYQFLLDFKGDKRKIYYAAGIITFAIPDYDCVPVGSDFPMKL